MLNKNILFIGGGNMAEGIIRGILKNDTMEASNVTVSEIISDRREYLKTTYNITVVPEASLAIKSADIVFVAVRPQDTEKTILSIKKNITKEQIVVSIVAGINLNRLSEWIGKDKKLVRVMPNVLIEARHGYSGICVSDMITENDKEIVAKLLDAIGQTMFIPENLFNEFTAFSCAGPAYVMYFAAALIDAGVEAGFARKDATVMVIENMIGSGMMLQQTKKHPYQITDTMTSPAGVTIEGCHVLSKSGFHGAVMDAVRAAVDRSNQF